MSNTPSQTPLHNHARKALLVGVLSSAALHFIPFGHTVGYPLLLLSTLAHEMGHGIAGVLVGAHFESFHMWQDGSGVALVTGNLGRISQAVVAAGGLVGPAIAAAALFLFGKNPPRAKLSLVALGCLFVIADIFVVRGLFGMLFVALLAAICFAIALKTPLWLSQASIIFVAIQLALSVFSRSDYLFTDKAQTSEGLMPSDVANISNALFLPYWFWGGVCGLFSVATLALGLWLFLKAPKPKKAIKGYASKSNIQT